MPTPESASVLATRDKVIAAVVAGLRTPRRGRRPKHWTQIDRAFETLRLGKHALVGHLGIATDPAA
jgi:hypothetical protein